MGGFAGWRARRHRGLFWSSVGAAIIMLIGGSVVAYDGYAATAGPDGAVKGYFAALGRGDAPAALGFGDVPAGIHTLLTRTVLREQQQIAPIRDVEILSSVRTGVTAILSLRYRLEFAHGAQEVSDTATVINHHGSWRLSASAVATQLNMQQASDRASIVGGSIPIGPVLMFPGAVPIRFDTPYLQLSAATSSVELASPARTNLTVEISGPGRTAVTTSLAQSLTPCLAGSPTAAADCPLPAPRAVPASLRARMVGKLGVDTTIIVENGAAGAIEVVGRVTVIGSYEVLNFNNIAVAMKGTVSLALQATAYATVPIHLTWQDGSS